VERVRELQVVDEAALATQQRPIFDASHAPADKLPWLTILPAPVRRVHVV
jgi:hypothetical protein